MIHIVHNNEQSGPYPKEEIRQKLESGDLLPADLAWKPGMKTWQTLSSFFDVPHRKRRLLTKSRLLLAGAAIAFLLCVILAWPHLSDIASDLIPRKPPLPLDETPLFVESQPNVDRALVFLRYIDDHLRLPQVASEDGSFNQEKVDRYLKQLQLAQDYARETGLDEEMSVILQDREKLLAKYAQILRSQLDVTEEHQIRTTQEVAVGSFDSGFKGGQAAAALASGGGSFLISAVGGLAVYAMDMWLTQLEKAPQRDRAYEERMRPLLEELRQSSTEADTNFNKAVQALSARHKWSALEAGTSAPQEHSKAKAEAWSSQNLDKLLSLVQAERESRPRDPFVAFSSALVSILANGNSANASDFEQTEKAALEAVALLPPDSFYDQFRSDFYQLAAYAALEQAKLSSKGAGYIEGPFDSSRALRLFLAARKCNPYDSSGQSRRRLGTAYALAGHFDKALALHEEVKGNFADNPEFQLDLARLYALTGKGLESLTAIDKLIRLPDFSDIKSLHSDKDLQQLRSNEEKIFRELTAVKTKAVIDMGYVWSDVILHNESPFPLTNVRFTPRIQQNGKTFSKELLRERIASGESYNWSGELDVTKDANGNAAESCDYTIECDQGTAEGPVAKK